MADKIDNIYLGHGDFDRLMRRHEVHFIYALFKDWEIMTEEQIQQRVERAAEFFNLPVPLVLKGCDVLAKISFSDETELGSEIRYDSRKLWDAGINNLDALDAMITHELSHQFLADKDFHFCKNTDWCKELACDFIVGMRCRLQNIASGKYKYMVSYLQPDEHHPPGYFRKGAVEIGFDFAHQLFIQHKIKPDFQYALLGITQFLCANSKGLNNEFIKFINTPPPEPFDVMSLPDSNLIKQYVLKHQSDLKK